MLFIHIDSKDCELNCALYYSILILGKQNYTLLLHKTHEQKLVQDKTQAMLNLNVVYVDLKRLLAGVFCRLDCLVLSTLSHACLNCRESQSRVIVYNRTLKCF